MNQFEDAVKRLTVNPIIRNIGRVIDRKNYPGVPIFIVASPRSGTTLLLSIMGAHPNIFAIPKQTYAFDRWRKVHHEHYQYYPYRIDRMYRYFIFHGYDKEPNRWCEKTPRHIQSIGKIADFFKGRVKIIHIIRDGRDVVTSKHPKHRPDEYWVTPDRWVGDVKNGLKYRKEKFMHTIFYEDLVDDYLSVVKGICEFVDEPFIYTLKEWTEFTNIRQSKHWKNGVEKVHKRAVEKWKQPEHKKVIEKLMNNSQAVDLLHKLGYVNLKGKK